MIQHLRQIAVLVLIAAVLVVAGVTRLYPWLNDLQVITIKGASMQPAIPFGSVAFIEQVDQPAKGDIVTYSDGNNLVTHRIIADVSGRADLWRTQGDNNPKPDPLVIRNDQILGRVTGYLPVFGIITELIANPAVIAFFLLLAMALMWRQSPGSPQRQEAHA